MKQREQSRSSTLQPFVPPWMSRTGSCPKLAPRDVASHVAVVGLLAETHLEPQVIQSDKLIRIDTGNLTAALPPSLFDAEPGAPSVRPIVAFYAPQDDYSLQVSLKDPLDELRVATHLLLSLGETQQVLRGGFTLTPLARKRMSFSFRMPSDWQLTSLYVQEGQQLKFDQYREEGDARYVVTLPNAMDPGVSQTVYFQATRTPSEWLNDWQTIEVPFPACHGRRGDVGSQCPRRTGRWGFHGQAKRDRWIVTA